MRQLLLGIKQYNILSELTNFLTNIDAGYKTKIYYEVDVERLTHSSFSNTSRHNNLVGEKLIYTSQYFSCRKETYYQISKS